MKKIFTIFFLFSLIGVNKTFSQTVTDYDGNVYDTITIGTQVWMKQNLKTTHYSDGTALVDGTSTGDITSISTIKYYFDYADNPAYITIYGKLYTWAAVMNGAVSSAANPSGVQGVCPTGWHIPSDAEWTSLENFLVANDYNYDGTTTGNKYAKSLASTSSWTSSSTIGAVGNTDYPTYRNKSGFSAIPGGFRYYYGSFYYIGSNGCWWSSTEGNATSAWIRSMSYESGNVYRVYDSKCDGFSVRCLRDLSVDIKEINKIEEINLYPNPATNNLTIETNKNATIEIINIQGQIIKTLSTLSTQTKLNISNLTNGVFTIRIKTDKEIIVKKLIKQ